MGELVKGKNAAGPFGGGDPRTLAISSPALFMRASTSSPGGVGHGVAPTLFKTSFESVTGGGKGRRPAAQAPHNSRVSSRARSVSSVRWMLSPTSSTKTAVSLASFAMRPSTSTGVPALT